MSNVLSIPSVGADLGHRGKPSAKKLAFLAAYCQGPTMMDPQRSAELAGYKGNLWQIGRRLEQELRPQIEAELSRKNNLKIMDLKEILQELTSLGRTPGRDQLGALRTLLEHSTGPTKDRRRDLQNQLGDLLSEIVRASPAVAVSLGIKVEPAGSAAGPSAAAMLEPKKLTTGKL